MHSDRGIFNEFPNFLRETAFIDRIHGLLPGWELPRVTRQTPSRCIGFKGDFFSEVLHQLRVSTSYADYASQNAKLTGCDDLRDQKAITRLASGFLKLLYPDMSCSPDDFALHCLRPAVELRQRIRDELCKMDQEFAKVDIGIEGVHVTPTLILAAPVEDPSEVLEETTSEDSVGTTESRIERIANLFPAVGSEVRKAHEMSETRPDAALLSARRGLELLLKEIYVNRIGCDPGRKPLFDIVTELDRGGYIPETIAQHLHSVRSLGNIAAHGDATSITSDDAHVAVLAALRTGEWAGEQILIETGTA